jgi:hypothetical protein
MSARLKDRNSGIPRDFQILHPEAGMTKPFRSPSFTGAKAFERSFRKGNPALCAKHGWSLDEAEIDNYVEQQNVARLIADGFTTFVEFTDGVAPPKTDGHRVLPGALAAAAGHLKNSSLGMKLMVQWLGDGLKPEPIDIAEKRAAICAVCPMNQDGNWIQKLDAQAAKQFRTLLQIRNDLSLKTKYEDKLKTCVACDCWTPLKVVASLKHIRANMSEETKAKLHPKCWIINE